MGLIEFFFKKSKPIPANKLGVTLTVTPEKDEWGVLWNVVGEYNGKRYKARSFTKDQAIRTVRDEIRKQKYFESLREEKYEI